jgi:hypothetical protein
VYKGKRFFGVKTAAKIANGIFFITFLSIESFTFKLVGTSKLQLGLSEIESIVSERVCTCCSSVSPLNGISEINQFVH